MNDKRKRTQDEQYTVDLVEFMKDYGFNVHPELLKEYERILRETKA